MTKPQKPINDSLKEFATATDWKYSEFVAWLHRWAGLLNDRLQLKLETPAIRVDRIRARAIGSYLNGHNGFGLEHEITFNTRYLNKHDPADCLDTLLHELIHEWQYLHGTPGKWNYHNKEFRDKARSFGLVIDERGRSIGVESGPFTQLLEEFGVDTSTLPLPSDGPGRGRCLGNSKMKKWSCGCTNVRCAVELRARCEKCGRIFDRAESLW